MLSRRKALKQMAVGCAALAMPKVLFSQTDQMMKRAIPSTGEKIGVVGLGTWQTFDVGNSSSDREPLKAVLKALVDGGGNVIDSSPMYGSSEKVVGDLSTELELKKAIFFATKVWTSGKQSGIDQMNASMRKMKANPMDLMQIHNLQDWKTHIKTLYDWKERGLIRYIGITHYVDSAHDDLERIIKSENIDFVQVNYSINDRNAEKSLLPTAKDQGVAVLTNRPYSGGSLFRKTRGQQLPEWADEFDCKSWGQFFLKYLLGNPAVTCVIPGTSKERHMIDNLGAGIGGLPDEVMRNRMVKHLQSL
ncbi:aldo/keto reductase [Ekhidna sp.]|jgi:diketogulonate reductase-like aldo/keto reductase|uniref:aldo/keto reductase n=1 Tax=Ekhidna sp. TaxID=2608089 RepID=UPI0032ED81F8